GLPDWPGIRAADRLDLLLRHPLSFSRPRNRELAAVAVFGAGGRAAFDADLAATLPGAAHPVREASRLMDCPGDWLVTVLGWVSLARAGTRQVMERRSAERPASNTAEQIASAAMDTTLPTRPRLPIRARLATTVGGAAATGSRLAGKGGGSVLGGGISLRPGPGARLLLAAR